MQPKSPLDQAGGWINAIAFFHASFILAFCIISAVLLTQLSLSLISIGEYFFLQFIAWPAMYCLFLYGLVLRIMMHTAVRKIIKQSSNGVWPCDHDLIREAIESIRRHHVMFSQLTYFSSLSVDDILSVFNDAIHHQCGSEAEGSWPRPGQQ